MSLKNKYKADTKAANDGVWFDFEDQPNEDGTVPGFLLGRNSTQNRKYAAVLGTITDAYVNKYKVKTVNELSDEAADEYEVDVFLAGVLFDWRNFQPDDDGKVMKYNEKNARKVFSDPDWSDLFQVLRVRAVAASNFQKEQDGKAVKNS